MSFLIRINQKTPRANGGWRRSSQRFGAVGAPFGRQSSCLVNREWSALGCEGFESYMLYQYVMMTCRAISLDIYRSTTVPHERIGPYGSATGD